MREQHQVVIGYLLCLGPPTLQWHVVGPQLLENLFSAVRFRFGGKGVLHFSDYALVWSSLNHEVRSHYSPVGASHRAPHSALHSPVNLLCDWIPRTFVCENTSCPHGIGVGVGLFEEFFVVIFHRRKSGWIRFLRATPRKYS